MFQRIGAAAYKADLTNTVKMMSALGDPQNELRCIHIAGTNGKGSVAAMLSSILQEAGLKTGLCTSPHLTDFRERVRINGEMIGKEQVMNFVRSHKDLFDEMDLSFFEWTVGLAFDHFRKEKVDIAVIETGMGGRLDSTNVVTPDVSVITNIGMDHTQFLGDTISKIAGEKAGIIKQGIPVVIGRHQAEADKVFIKRAEETGSRIVFAGDHYKVIQKASYPEDTNMMKVLKDGEVTFDELYTPLTGSHQQENIETVLTVIDELENRGMKIHKEHVRDGISKVLANTGFAGRWEVVSTRPALIFDVGHNRDGLQHVVRQIRRTPHEKLILVLGMSSDKDHEDILKMFPADATYHFARTSVPRSADPELLRSIAASQGKAAFSHGSVADALITAQKQASEEDLIFLGGSFFAVADAMKFLEGRSPGEIL
jgi:dihydrofolate synthase/folylpolyglutamate synthase